MRNKLKTIKSLKQKAPDSPQQRFQDYWASIEKYQKQIQTLQQQQETLFQQFRQELLPIEHQFLQTVYDKTARLISFGNKKSLKKSQKEALLLWIKSELDNLSSHPFNELLDIQKLTDQYIDLYALKDHELPDAQELDELRQMMTEQFDLEEDLSDEEIIELLRNPQKMQAKVDEHFKQQAEYFAEEYFTQEETDGEYDDREDEEFIPEPGSQQQLDKLFKSQEVNQMYKKIAKALHPDREQDPEEKERKHHLMVELSKAKKAHDVWTIMNMYHRYIDDEFSFAEQELPAVNLLLKNRVDALDAELRQLKQDHSLPAMVWNKLGAKTTRTVEKRFREHREALQTSIADEREELESLRSLAALKRALAARQQTFFFDEDLFELFSKK